MTPSDGKSKRTRAKNSNLKKLHQNSKQIKNRRTYQKANHFKKTEEVLESAMTMQGEEKTLFLRKTYIES